MNARLVLPIFLLTTVALTAQEEHQHHEHGAQMSTPGGAAAAGFQPALEAQADAYELADLVKLAVESNPTIQQAEAAIDEAQGVRKQVSRYPNPTIGATGDENTPNTTFRGGEIGMFIEQRIVTGGKLGLNRDIAAQREAQARAVAAAQRQKVHNAVRALFYEALGADWQVDVARRLAELTADAAGVTRELANVGQADQPDVLRGEIEAQRAQLELRQAQNQADRAWSQLALMTGGAGLARKPLRGRLEDFPMVDEVAVRERLLQSSPQVSIASSEVERAKLAVQRAQIDKWPDIMVHGGFRNSPFIGRDGRPIGREGFFDVGIEVPVFDRRKGAVRAAKADADRAELETTRLRLALSSELAEEYQEYRDAVVVAEFLRDEMLPRAVEAHETYLAAFERMAAAYPQVLIAGRDRLELEQEYIEALVAVWHTAVKIEGQLLTGGLDAPGSSAAAEMMGEDSDDRLVPTALRRHR